LCQFLLQNQVPEFLSPYWYAYEVWYKVIDRNTIIEIYSKPLHYMSESDWKIYYEAKKHEKKKLPAKFISIEVLPNSNCWLKKERWFLCE